MKKRIVSLLQALVMVLSLVPTTVWAAEDHDGQVRAEARKIVWPSRKETWITSVMVFIMVSLATVFFWIVDYVLAKISTWLLALG